MPPGTIVVLGNSSRRAEVHDPDARRRALGFSTALGGSVTGAAAKYVADGVDAWHHGAGRIAKGLILPATALGAYAGYQDKKRDIERALKQETEQSSAVQKATGGKRTTIIDASSMGGGGPMATAIPRPDSMIGGVRSHTPGVTKMSSLLVGTPEAIPMSGLAVLRAEFPGRSDSELLMAHQFGRMIEMQRYHASHQRISDIPRYDEDAPASGEDTAPTKHHKAGSMRASDAALQQYGTKQANTMSQYLRSAAGGAVLGGTTGAAAGGVLAGARNAYDQYRRGEGYSPGETLGTMWHGAVRGGTVGGLAGAAGMAIGDGMTDTHTVGNALGYAGGALGAVSGFRSAKPQPQPGQAAPEGEQQMLSPQMQRDLAHPYTQHALGLAVNGQQHHMAQMQQLMQQQHMDQMQQNQQMDQMQQNQQMHHQQMPQMHAIHAASAAKLASASSPAHGWPPYGTRGPAVIPERQLHPDEGDSLFFPNYPSGKTKSPDEERALYREYLMGDKKHWHPDGYAIHHRLFPDGKKLTQEDPTLLPRLLATKGSGPLPSREEWARKKQDGTKRASLADSLTVILRDAYEGKMRADAAIQAATTPPMVEQQLPDNMDVVSNAFETYGNYRQQIEEQVARFNSAKLIQHKGNAAILLHPSTRLLGLTP